MARFTSVHPLQFTDPAAQFVPSGGEYVLETGDEQLAARVRAVAATFGIREAGPDDLETRTVEDLKGYAVEYGIDLTGATLKADIVAAIRAHFDSIGEPAPTVEAASLPADAPALTESQPVPAADEQPASSDTTDPADPASQPEG